jgi:glycosyltransferase involved in cell wall biosynthesis
VDDASPDRCPQICEEYARRDSRVKVIHKPKNEGLPQARKTGYEASRGEYIQFVDSDDWIEAEMTERMVHKAIRENLDIVYCDVREVFTDGTQAVRKSFDMRGGGDDNRRLVAALLSRELPWSLWNKIFHRKLFNGLIFPKFNLCEDGVICPQLFLNAERIGYEYSLLYNHFRHSESMSTRPAKTRKREIEQNMILLDAILAERPDYDLYKAALRALKKNKGTRSLPLWKKTLLAIVPRRILLSYTKWRLNV